MWFKSYEHFHELIRTDKHTNIVIIGQTKWSCNRPLQKGRLGYKALPRHPIYVTLHPQNNLSWVPNCLLGPSESETKLFLKKCWYRLCENAWFPWQPIVDLRMSYAYKITRISADTYPRLLN